MEECETRIIKIDPDHIRLKLKQMKAINVKMENQTNYIYDFKDGRLIKNKGYARIRVVEDLLHNSNHFYMTTKKLLSQEKYKVMEENETEILDAEAGKRIFRSLGLNLLQAIKKYRESYRYKNSLIEIDINDTSFCPFPYIEIETKSDSELNELVELLGYSIKDTTSKTIYEILNEK
ncbi:MULTISPECIES: class IV adenylate cyclase [Clostridium]|uniref:CYTH domain protein n=2 Tax=Clostridium TaxID=1485 RepID=D8GLG8_CLOLD|nr:MULTISPECIES: CYTH domain-containing protein [Clostridium]ADK13364.1 putative adenylate cyclase [Clostridium ljungdahlii DSM 13528]OAA88982.1 CYTH domain protein [Clostridium ljungdahlii DSM 13528]RMD04868.1 CYTH domain-containing protein [Clostridium autoethanogenum]